MPGKQALHAAVPPLQGEIYIINQTICIQREPVGLHCINIALAAHLAAPDKADSAVADRVKIIHAGLCHLITIADNLITGHIQEVQAHIYDIFKIRRYIGQMLRIKAAQYDQAVGLRLGWERGKRIAGGGCQGGVGTVYMVAVRNASCSICSRSLV